MTRHLLVIGAQRSGTTYLHGLLDAHPDITMARPSRPEPKVFLDPDRAGQGLDWYRSTYFAHAGSEALLGEKSTSYIEHPEAAALSAKVLGDPQIVALLRDPLERAVSNWRFSAAHGLEERPLDEALTENLARPREWDRAATSVSPFAYLERGRYDDHLDAWDREHPGRLRVVFHEELVADASALAELYAALGVEPAFRPEGLGQRVNAADGPAPALDPGTVAAVRDYFAGSDARLRERLGRELPWAGR